MFFSIQRVSSPNFTKKSNHYLICAHETMESLWESNNDSFVVIRAAYSTPLLHESAIGTNFYLYLISVNFLINILTFVEYKIIKIWVSNF
jgi:hypothetical protein